MVLRKLSGVDIIKALSKVGFVPKRRKGSHVVLVRQFDGRTVCVVPMHSELKIGTIKAILRQAKIREDEFLVLL